MAENTLVVFSTFGSAEEARRVSRTVVEEHLAACANILPAIESIYHWKGAVETATETLVLFKTSRERYLQFEHRLKELHSYEVPEIVALPIQAGLSAYLQWIQESCREAS